MKCPRMMPGLLIASALLLSARAGAETPSRWISYGEAVSLATGSPDVVGAKAAAKALDRSSSSVRGPSDNLSLTLGSAYRRLSDGDVGPDLSGAISQRWNASGLIAARQSLAREQDQLARQRVERKTLAEQIRLSDLWIESWRTQARQKVWSLAMTDADARLALIGEAVREQLATRADMSSARAHREQANRSLIDARGHQWSAGLALAYGIEPEARAPILAAGPLPSFEVPTNIPPGDMDSRLRDLPAVRESLQQMRVARANIRTNRASTGRGLQAALSAAREHPGDYIIGAALTFDFASGSPNHGAVAKAHEAHALAQGNYEKALRSAGHEIAFLVHEREHTRELLAAIETQELPALENSLADLESLAKLGEVPQLELFRARSQLHEATLRRIDARAEEARVAATLYLIFGALGDVEP